MKFDSDENENERGNEPDFQKRKDALRYLLNSESLEESIKDSVVDNYFD